MAELKIRKVDPVVIKKLDDLAKQHHMSREQYLRAHLSKLASMPELEEVEDKYSGLVMAVVERLERTDEMIEINNMYLEKVLAKMNDDGYR